MTSPKLDRSVPHTINAHRDDRLDLWPSQLDGDRHNLNINDREGTTVLTIYNLTQDKLAAFSLQIAAALGHAPDVTRFHLKQAHEIIGRLLGEVVRPHLPPTEPKP
jgi:hypothetical protein